MTRMAQRIPRLVYLAALLALAPAAAHADGGHDFIKEARLLYRAAACGGTEPVSGSLDARVVEAHCREQSSRVERFRKRYVDKARPFLGRHVPADVPKAVVYPFGGGDLVSALITYPQATEITTISLEHAGDPRRLAGLPGGDLKKSLELFREVIHGLLMRHDSASENLRKLERGPIPGQLSFFLQGLAALDYEPVSLRYFRIEEDGSLHYYSLAEIEALDDTVAKKKASKWVDTDYSVAFSNTELAFRRRGAPGEPLRIHRHIAANLADQHFAESPLHKHLARKGRIAAMTKAASYLLWSGGFTKIRDYLLDNMAFMVSDSTGIPPVHARRKGFVQKTFGTYTGPFLQASPQHDQAFVELWQSQPTRKLPFRYGYPDAAGNYHLLLTMPGKKRAQ